MNIPQIRQGWHQGRARGLQPPRRRHLAPRRKFLVLVAGNFARICTKTPFFNHCSPPVGSQPLCWKISGATPDIRFCRNPPVPLLIC